MKLAGLFLLFAGWLLVPAALTMLQVGLSRNIFVLAGVCVQATGLTISVRAHRVTGEPAGNRR